MRLICFFQTIRATVRHPALLPVLQVLTVRVTECTNKCNETDVFNSKKTLYAGWLNESEVVYYTVRFNVERANHGTVVPATLRLTPGSKVPMPELIPERNGSTFFGWCIVNGATETLWDFENDTVTKSITLVAVFRTESNGGGDDTGDDTGDDCEHVFEITESVAPTCRANGKITKKCTLCRMTVRVTATDDPSLKRLEHLTLEERVEPTCAVDGYSRIYCPNGCGETNTFVLKATGKHEYDEFSWYTALQPTKYVNGRLQNDCVVCGGASLFEVAPFNALEEELAIPDVSFLYTGGTYVNEPFVNVATHGRVNVSSYYTVAKGTNINDGDALTAWNADTYVDGADYASDWFSLEFMQAYEIGAIRFILPNYYDWELGEDCYVSYDIEYWDEATQSWIFIDEVSDKDATSIGINCAFMIELDAPITTSKIRAKVTHAGRYTPAAVYELEVYAKTQFTQRVPVAVNAEGTYSVSGKYNEWVSGAGALSDNSTGTFWTTDGRYNPTPWALVEFPVDKYIACVQFATAPHQSRRFKLEVYSDGKWETIGDKYTVPEKGEIGGEVISNNDSACIFNVEIEKVVSKIRLTIVKEPVYWESKMYFITPYSVVEKSLGELDTMDCKHSNPRAGEVVAPTCTTPGYTVMDCACGAKIKSNAVDKLGHEFGKYTIDTPATATTLGTKVSSCKHEGCNAVNTITYEENYDAPVITPYLHNAPAAWAQSLDDGNYLDTYVWANEHMARYNYRATIMMSITYVDALVSTWQDHFTRGVFDLGSHSYNHTAIYAGAASEGSLYDEVIKAQHWFRHNFKGEELLVFAAPLGTTSPSVASYLAGPLAANRNGGQGTRFYNVISDLEAGRTAWGNLNSYISKADQTEGEYVFVKKATGEVYVMSINEETGEEQGYVATDAYAHKGVNFIFDYSSMSFVDKGYEYAGTYYFDGTTYKYEYLETGSYSFDGEGFSFVGDNSGEFKLVKATIGSYEKGVETLVAANGFTVECVHSFGWGSIYSSYESTISKFEHMARFGVWGCSFNELIKYLKEAESSTVETLERTEDTIKISVTDELDNFMFNQAVTVKVDIPDSWTSVSVTQNGKEIKFVDYEYYSSNRNYIEISCAIDEGYLYVDVIPDGGDVVITAGNKDASVDDYKDRVTVTFEPNGGELDSNEYETKVVIGEAISSVLPTPERYGYYFKGWFTDEACTTAVSLSAVYTENATLYAGWEEIPLCSDGTYDHKWGPWLPSSGTEETHTCTRCQATETLIVETEE